MLNAVFWALQLHSQAVDLYWCSPTAWIRGVVHVWGVVRGRWHVNFHCKTK